MNPWIFSGLAVGLVFGFALQRGRFCMNSAFRDIILLKDYTLIKSVGVALLVAMFGFGILALAGTGPFPKPIIWGGNLVGSFVFGFGMVLAGGCASGITYRVGEGMVGAMVAAVGLALGATLTAMSFLKPVAGALKSAQTVITNADGSTTSYTLANVFNLPYYVMAIGIAVVAGVIWFVLAQRNKSDQAEDTGDHPVGERIFKRPWGWLATGIAIGLIQIASLPLSAAAGRNYPLGITSGWVKIAQIFVPSVPIMDSLKWDLMVIVGIIVGALIAALIAGEFKFRVPSWGVLVQTLVGGFLMGFGAVCSTGCNIGHVLSGVPQLSLGSMLATFSIIVGCWLAAYLIFLLPQQRAA